MGCRVSDGHLFEIQVWEQPSGPQGRDWSPNAIEVDAVVRQSFTRWNVVGFYADPSGWTEWTAKWEAAFGRRLRVKASQREPIALWPRGKNTLAVDAIENLRQAIYSGECSHNGSSALTRHVLNARRRPTRNGYLIYKAYPESPDKIDAAYAASMAWRARTDAIAARIGEQHTSTDRRAVLL